MAVAGRGHGNAGGEIQKGIAVHVLDEHALPSAGDQRIVACIRRGNKLAVERKDLLRFGPWQYRLDVRQSLPTFTLLRWRVSPAGSDGRGPRGSLAPFQPA